MPEHPLTGRSRRWLLAALLLVVLPHAWHLPAWVALFVLGSSALYYQRLQLPGERLPRPLLPALTAMASGGVFLQYGTLLGRNAGVSLLVLMLALKLLETRRRRDAVLVLFTAYFVVITNFLFTQSPLIALYMFAISIVITATLSMITHDSARRPSADYLRLATTLLLQALPVMVVLFIFFPRIVGPLWGLPADAHSGVTGLSDTMRPGSISRLVESGDTAFRARFIGPAPEPGARYWRGPVLWNTDGLTWTTGRLVRHAVPPRPQQSGDKALLQEITLEPHNKRWLPGLDRPVALSVPAVITAGSDWLAPRAVHERIRYTVTSLTSTHDGNLDPRLRAAALQLPATPAPRLHALAERWRLDADDRDVVRQALAYFHDEPFIYTLNPPLLKANPMEEFLFGTRRGFCEHYAAAFVLLMRHAGIPARVVTGYQGGEYNPVGDYWLVRQSDAHAWAEVWLDGAGWERVDPTAAVAPERIEHALDMDSAESGAPARFRLPASGLLAGGWRALRYALDTLNNNWNQWVLTYGPTRQLELLKALGISNADWKTLVLLLLVLVGALLLALAARMFLKARRPVDPVLAGYRDFCRRMARLGMVRRPAEGPLDFSRRIINNYPALAGRVRAITDLYIMLRYAHPRAPAGLRARFVRLVRQLPRRVA